MRSIVTVEDVITWITSEGGTPRILNSYTQYQRWAVYPNMTKDEW